MADLQQIFDSTVGFIVGMTIVEVLVKPTAIWVGKHLLRKADEKVDVIPDWLYKDD